LAKHRRERARRAELACQHLGAGCAPHRPRLGRHQADRHLPFRKAACDLEYRDWTCGIEQLEVGEDQHADHGFDLMS